MRRDDKERMIWDVIQTILCLVGIGALLLMLHFAGEL